MTTIAKQVEDTFKSILQDFSKGDKPYPAEEALKEAQLTLSKNASFEERKQFYSELREKLIKSFEIYNKHLLKTVLEMIFVLQVANEVNDPKRKKHGTLGMFRPTGVNELRTVLGNPDKLWDNNSFWLATPFLSSQIMTTIGQRLSIKKPTKRQQATTEFYTETDRAIKQLKGYNTFRNDQEHKASLENDSAARSELKQEKIKIINEIFDGIKDHRGTAFLGFDATGIRQLRKLADKWAYTQKLPTIMLMSDVDFFFSETQKIIQNRVAKNPENKGKKRNQKLHDFYLKSKKSLDEYYTKTLFDKAVTAIDFELRYYTDPVDRPGEQALKYIQSQFELSSNYAVRDVFFDGLLKKLKNSDNYKKADKVISVAKMIATFQIANKAFDPARNKHGKWGWFRFTPKGVASLRALGNPSGFWRMRNFWDMVQKMWQQFLTIIGLRLDDKKLADKNNKSRNEETTKLYNEAMGYDKLITELEKMHKSTKPDDEKEKKKEKNNDEKDSDHEPSYGSSSEEDEETEALNSEEESEKDEDALFASFSTTKFNTGDGTELGDVLDDARRNAGALPDINDGTALYNIFELLSNGSRQIGDYLSGVNDFQDYNELRELMRQWSGLSTEEKLKTVKEFNILNDTFTVDNILNHPMLSEHMDVKGEGIKKLKNIKKDWNDLQLKAKVERTCEFLEKCKAIFGKHAPPAKRSPSAKVLSKSLRDPNTRNYYNKWYYFFNPTPLPKNTKKPFVALSKSEQSKRFDITDTGAWRLQ